jgi:hypothetical protein
LEKRIIELFKESIHAKSESERERERERERGKERGTDRIEFFKI